MKNQSVLQSRRIAAAVVVAMLASIVTPSVQAAGPVPLSDVPLQVQNTSKPNIVYTVDDSTSMGSNFLPDYTVIADNNPAFTNNNWCRDANGFGENARCGTQGSPTAFAAISFLAPVVAAGFNHIYYDPTILYVPPVATDGINHYPTMSSGNTAGWTKVYADNWWIYPYSQNPTLAAAANRADLSVKINVTRWCNSEWPKNLLNPANVNDAAWNDSDFCRISGYAYPAGSGAPSVSVDYNYPFRDTAAGTPDGASFYLTYTQMYCDPTKMDTTTGPSCTANGDGINCLATQCQTSSTPCSIWNPYVPAGCNTNPLYGPPGPCVGAECLTGCGRTCNTFGPTTYTCTTPTTVTNPIVWCDPNSGTAAQKIAAARYLAEANNPADGNTCRHANMTYASGTQGGLADTRNQFFTAGSRGAYTKQVTCAAPPVKSVPRHYYKVGALWCDNRIPSTSVADKWKGYGQGNCQTFKDAAHPNVKFVQNLAEFSGNTDNYLFPAFERCDLDVATLSSNCLTHLIWDDSLPIPAIAPMKISTWDPATMSIVDQSPRVTRSFDEEMENYANWFAYYRTRILATKTISSLSFKELDDKFRVGYHTLSNSAGSFVNVADFTPAQKTTWFTALHTKTVVQTSPAKQTPSLDTLTRIGEYFLNGTSAALPGSSDPINLSCQRNYHVMFTDGATNQPALPSPASGNVDNAATTDLPRPEPFANNPVFVYGQCYDSIGVPGCGVTFPKAWPRPIVENVAGGNTLSDIALKYWMTDLRCTGVGCVTGGPANITTNNVGGWSGDPAVWQHLNFSALSLGAEGTLPGENQPQTISEISSGARSWPSVSPPYKPTPDVKTAIDDLWHATVNGFGKFVNAQNPLDLKFGLGQILKEVGNQPGSRSGIAFTSLNLANPNARFAYRATFEPHWGGTLTKFEFDPVNTNIVTDTVWNAALQLTTQLTPGPGHPAPWFDNRLVVTTNDQTNARVSFQFGNLSASQQSSLGANAQIQQNVIEYIRGNSAKEGITRGKYRYRGSPPNLLGDIVNATPVVVGPKLDPVTYPPIFADATDPGYSAFVSSLSMQTRPTRIYAASNDGMVHAFRDIDETIGMTTYPAGTEHWAYVPSLLYRAGQGGLGSLPYQEGGNPPFEHHYFVDSTPRTADVRFDDGSWHTILVGGMGKGGKGYYAIDITDPTAIAPDPATGEGQLAGKILWEYKGQGSSNLNNMGYTYGKPLIAKTRADGWVVIVTSGFNNMAPDFPGGDGFGHLYFLNPRTGALIREMVTPIPSNGFAHIAGFVKDFHDQTLEQIYGGDLYGNVWRFDVSGCSTCGSGTWPWTVTKFAELSDGVNPQPVTTPPQIEVDLNNSYDRWVFVGTGKLLADADLTDVSIQSMYALRDGTVAQPRTAALPIRRSDLPMATSEVTDINGLSALPSVGWYDDLPAGQRIVIDPQAELNVVAYVGTIPGTDPCTTGQPGWIYAREFTKGQSKLHDTTGTYVESWKSDSGAVSIQMLSLNTARGGTIDDPILPPTIKGAINNAVDGRMVTFDIDLPPLSGSHRMMWRIIGE